MPKWPPSSAERSSSRRPAESESRRPLTWVLVALVEAYRLLLGPLLPRSCRFTPSCSTFAVEALEQHGARTGGMLALRRIARCHPWNPGGYDPVPGREV